MTLTQAAKYQTTIFTAVAVAMVSLFGCSVPKYVASSNQDGGVQKVYRQGLELLVSQKEQSTVVAGLRRLKKKEKHMQLILLMRNQGNSAFNVKPTEVTVLFEEEGSTERLPIYPPDEAVGKITFNERLTAALNAAAASYNQNTNISTETNENLAQGSALAAIAEGNNVRSTLLRRETLFAGNEIAGATYFALKDAGRLKIKVPAGNESHTFNFVSREE